MTESTKTPFQMIELDMKSARVCGDLLLLRRYPAPTQTAGGLELPKSAQEQQQKAWIIAAGPGATLQFHIGDTVIFPPYAATAVPELSTNKEEPEIILIEAADIAICWPISKEPSNG